MKKSDVEFFSSSTEFSQLNKSLRSDRSSFCDNFDGSSCDRSWFRDKSWKNDWFSSNQRTDSQFIAFNSRVVEIFSITRFSNVLWSNFMKDSSSSNNLSSWSSLMRESLRSTLFNFNEKSFKIFVLITTMHLIVALLTFNLNDRFSMKIFRFLLEVKIYSDSMKCERLFIARFFHHKRSCRCHRIFIACSFYSSLWMTDRALKHDSLYLSRKYDVDFEIFLCSFSHSRILSRNSLCDRCAKRNSYEIENA